MGEFLYYFFVKFIVFVSISIISITLIFKINDLNMNDRFSKESMIEIKIEKYLDRVYALDGEYPNDIFYLESFGLGFDLNKYDYQYDFVSVYKKPSISVVKKAVE